MEINEAKSTLNLIVYEILVHGGINTETLFDKYRDECAADDKCLTTRFRCKTDRGDIDVVVVIFSLNKLKLIIHLDDNYSANNVGKDEEIVKINSSECFTAFIKLDEDGMTSSLINDDKLSLMSFHNNSLNLIKSIDNPDDAFVFYHKLKLRIKGKKFRKLRTEIDSYKPGWKMNEEDED
jgi:hypothetical protein